jgi:CHC2 zinc finger
MATQTIDFQQVKARCSIHQAAQMLDLKLVSKGEQMRGPCPRCKQGGDRAIVITPGRNVFYCFAAKKGGDQLALVSHIRDVPVREAAELIQDHYGTDIVPAAREQVPSSRNSSGTSSPSLAPQARASLSALTYLEPENEAVQALGISPGTAQAFGSGYAGKGVLRGRYAVPVRTLDGALVAYVGIAVSAEQSPRLLFHNFQPEGFVWNADKVAEGGELYVCRDPLDAILAVENGVPAESVVSFLAPITAQALEALSSLMDSRKVEAIELY